MPQCFFLFLCSIAFASQQSFRFRTNDTRSYPIVSLWLLRRLKIEYNFHQQNSVVRVLPSDFAKSIIFSRVRKVILVSIVFFFFFQYFLVFRKTFSNVYLNRFQTVFTIITGARVVRERTTIVQGLARGILAILLSGQRE